MQDAVQTENYEVEEIENDGEELVAPSTRDVENSLEILKSLSLFNEKRSDQMQDLINKFQTLLTRDKVEKSKQVKITRYFVKEKYIFTVILLDFLCLLVHLPRDA